jgi:hypothetical protein
MDERRQWHRWFGMCWTDFFTGLPVTVEMEKDLSIKQQFLDVVIVRKGADPIPRRPPDGFEELAAHNLISFKSFQEPLDGWALKELVGHYVNYRKQVSPDFDHLLPEEDFRLFAVCVRSPEKLAKGCALDTVQPGVYRIAFFDSALRLVVVNELPEAEHNAMLYLFSYQQDRLDYGGRHYRRYCPDTSTFLVQLYAKYAQEGFDVPFTYEQGIQEAVAEILRDMPTEALRKAVPVEKLLEAVPVEKRLEGVPAEVLLPHVPPEKRVEGMSGEELLRALSPERQEELRRLLRASAPPVATEKPPSDPA